MYDKKRSLVELKQMTPKERDGSKGGCREWMMSIEEYCETFKKGMRVLISRIKQDGDELNEMTERGCMEGGGLDWREDGRASHFLLKTLAKGEANQIVKPVDVNPDIDSKYEFRKVKL